MPATLSAIKVIRTAFPNFGFIFKALLGKAISNSRRRAAFACQLHLIFGT